MAPPRSKTAKDDASARDTGREAETPPSFVSTILWRIGPWALLVGFAAYALSPFSATLMAVLIVGLGIVYRFTPSTSRRPRRTLTVGAGILLLGLALVGTGSPEAGSGVTLLALIVMMFGIHTFGRLGPDEPDGPDGPAAPTAERP